MVEPPDAYPLNVAKQRQPRHRRAATAKRLKAKGYDNARIAASMDVTKGYVEQLLRDPEGERNRASYRRYSVPLGEDYFTCRICGRQLRILGAHLRWAHDMDVREYRKRFPGAKTISDSERAARAEIFSDQVGRSGEPRYWTRQRITTAIGRWAAQRGGKPPTKAQWWTPQGTTPLDRVPDRPSVYTVVKQSAPGRLRLRLPASNHGDAASNRVT